MKITKRITFFLLGTSALYAPLYAKDKAAVMNDFHAIMSSVNIIKNYIPKISTATSPILSLITQTKKSIEESFKPIKDKLFVIAQIEGDQSWLVKLICAEGGAQVRNDVNDIQKNLNTTLDTLQATFTNINNLTTAPAFTQFTNDLQSNSSIKEAVAEITSMFPDITQNNASQSNGTSTQTFVPITYSRKMTIRNTSTTPVTVTQIQIPSQTLSLFNDSGVYNAQTDESERSVGIIQPKKLITWDHISTGAFSLSFAYQTKTITAQIPATPDRICIDVNEIEAKKVDCTTQIIPTYTRTLRILNITDQQASVGQIVMPNKSDLFGKMNKNESLLQKEAPPKNNNVFNALTATIKKVAESIRATTVTRLVNTQPGVPYEFEHVTTAPFALTITLKNNDKPITGIVPQSDDNARTCLQINGQEVTEVRGGWCDLPLTGYTRRLKFLNTGSTEAIGTQINVKDKDLIGQPLKQKNGNTRPMGAIRNKGQQLYGDNVTTLPFEMQVQFRDPKVPHRDFSNDPATGTKISITVPQVLQGTKTCIEFNEKGSKVVTGGWCNDKAENEN